MAPKQPLRVALVGRRIAHNENLGLAYLRAALRCEGIRSHTYYVNDRADMLQAGRAIVESQPELVAMSLADSGSALLPLALGEFLQCRGYGGHITCGGQFATLARQWLLARYRWLDSVVRFAGERPLTQLVARVGRGESVNHLTGVSTRAGDGPPANVLDSLPMQLRPERDELPAILDFNGAHVAASRGCWGRCSYCGPAALQSLERHEGKRAGLTPAMLNHAGVGGLRRRSLANLCDELAELYHERAVRYVYFVDEHLLPYREAEALAYLDQWQRELDRRNVGPLGIGAMLRANRLSPAIVRRFAESLLLDPDLLLLAVGVEEVPSGPSGGQPEPRG